MVMVLKYGRINLNMKDTMFMVKRKAMENIFGMTGHSTLGIGRKIC